MTKNAILGILIRNFNIKYHQLEVKSYFQQLKGVFPAWLYLASPQSFIVKFSFSLADQLEILIG